VLVDFSFRRGTGEIARRPIRGFVSGNQYGGCALLRAFNFAIILLFASQLFAVEPTEIVGYLDAERNSPPLKYSKKLAAAAQSQADWMASVGKMKHLRGQQPTSFKAWLKSDHHPVNRVIQTGYVQWDTLFVLKNHRGRQTLVAKGKPDDYVGEIIAHGNPKSGPGRFQPSVIVRGWMNSPGHRKAILRGYTEVGVGFARTSRGDAFWCVVFGRK
tara:strand:+ start:6863 stop:7507 length:645 start_codon:yes stop_codon:yes gene_type:complete